MVGLGELPSADFCSSAEAVSADGAVVIGYSDVWIDTKGQHRWEIFRWMEETGMVGLGFYGLHHRRLRLEPRRPPGSLCSPHP